MKEINGIVSEGGSANAAALLTGISTSQGFLPPTMTTTQRDAIASPATGLTIYNSTTQRLNTYTGTSWETLGSRTVRYTATADFTNKSTAFMKIPGFTVYLQANETWSFEGYILVKNGSTGGLTMNVVAPSGSAWMWVDVGNVSATTSIACDSATDSVAAANTGFYTATNDKGWFNIYGAIVNGSTAGALSIVFHPVSSGTVSTIFTGSTFMASQIS
jgi:hypothetical protein